MLFTKPQNLFVDTRSALRESPKTERSMSATLSPGTLFGGRYRIVRCIAEGGMGAVYEAAHLETEGHHALKIMHAHLFKSEELRERFRREARVTAKIKSEYIIQISDAGIDQNTQMPFMVMELLHGEELGDILEKKGRLHPALAVTCLRQVASALNKTHAANIIHRDLKPENLFLTYREDGSPQIKILDFGIAKIIEASMAGKGTQSVGTPVYMAPEQVNPAIQLTGAADIYALGMVAFALLVGVPYWTKELQTAGGLIPFINIVSQGPKIPAVQRAAEFGVVLPPNFDAWFIKITALQPNKRFHLASEAVQALEQALTGWVSLPPVDRPSIGSLATQPTAPSDLPSLSMAPTHVLPADRISRSSGPPAPPIASSGAGSMDAMVTVPREQRAKYRPILIFAIAMGALSALVLGFWFLLRSSSSSNATTTDVSGSAAPGVQAATADSFLKPDGQPSAELKGSSQPAPSAPSSAPTVDATPVKTAKQPSVSKPPPTSTTRKPSLHGQD